MLIVRYLYADSEPFPLGYDFLASLESLIRHASRAADHLWRLSTAETQVAQSAKANAESQKLIEQFGDQAEGALGTVILTAPSHPLVTALGEELVEAVRKATAQRLAESDAVLKRANASLLAEVQQHREGARAELEQFLLEAELDATTRDATIELRDGAYAIEATRQLAGDIAVTYAIDANRFTAWAEPRKLASLADLDELQVGLKKKFLRSDMTREMVRVADHTILSVHLQADQAEIQIARKGDKLLLSLEREADGIAASIERPQPDSHSMFPAVPSDAQKLASLWATLEEVSHEALHHRQAVVDVKVDGVEVFAIEQPELLLDRLLQIYAPVVAEIARRSPSPRELSLKVEHPDGRREERYVRKSTLAAFIAELHPQVRKRFEVIPYILAPE